MMKRSISLVTRLTLIAILLLTFVRMQKSAFAMHRTSTFPYVSGTQIISPSGQPLLLRGAQIASSFNYAIPNWPHNNTVTSKLNSAVFNSMATDWHMNVLRLPISNWIYTSYPKQYMSLLDQVVGQANAAGLYVVLALHDDLQSGSPYGANAEVPKPESLAFWQFIAAHYLTNPMVMFDLFNESDYPDANTWLNGGGTITGSTGLSTTIVGMQTLVNAIRAVGAQQIIIVDGVSVAGNLRINDPNIVYTDHYYHQVTAETASQWTANWGSFWGKYPLYIGEWALLPNTAYPYQCQGATMANADQEAIAFMNYMDQYGINWTAWEFDTYYLIQDHTTFTPTRMDDPTNPWTCNTPSSTAGMGTVVKEHLISLALNGGSLSETANSGGGLAAVTLNGKDQTASYSLPITLSDTRTSAAGWHLTITSTQFSTSGANNYQLSQYASQIASVTAACSTTCTSPTNGIAYPLTVPAGVGQLPISFYQAIPYTGMGTFTVTPTINVQVPSNTYAGNYTSTITLAVVSGP